MKCGYDREWIFLTSQESDTYIEHRPVVTLLGVACSQCGQALKVILDPNKRLTWVTPLIIQEWP